MSNVQNDRLLQMETTSGTLLYELQIIWDEVGEIDADRDKVLLEIEQECLEVYRKKVDQANHRRAQLRQTIADYEAELAAICSTMGERPVHIRQLDKNAESLNEELNRILPEIEEMRKRKSERSNQFLELLEKIEIFTDELYSFTEHVSSNPVVDETDLSLRKLEELDRQLKTLQKEKSDRLKQSRDHLKTLNSLCSVLGMDFNHTISQINPSLCEIGGPGSISNTIIEELAATVHKLREVKIQRMQRLQDLATTMLELWNLMDTPLEEQQEFQNVTCNIAASEDEMIVPDSLSIDFLKYVEAEVSRLDEFKSSKLKELVLKKRSELDEICRKTHMIPESDSGMEHVIQAIESGEVDPASVLEQIEVNIGEVKEAAFSRKEILEKVEKWVVACEEESWLEEYNRDENRYNAGKGTHLTLKRAEKARALVTKLPGMVEAISSKTVAWEKERGTEFLYDGIRVLSMLEEYTILRQEKEQERRRQRDQKKLQGQFTAEKEAMSGSKPNLAKLQSTNKGPRISGAGGQSSKRLSVGTTVDSLQPTIGTPQSRSGKKIDQVLQTEYLSHRLDDGFTALSTGRRGLEIAGPMKKQSFRSVTAYELESPPMIRKPFSPITTLVSSQANITNSNIVHGDTLQKTILFNESLFISPLKTAILVDEENRTPKTKTLHVLTTPATISVPMRTPIAPAPTPTPTPPPPPPPVFCNRVEDKEIEYSVEERRLGFVIPRTYVGGSALLHV